ncbi:serine protease easter isoform X2 [Drosophila innubila]|uniref:serine protease easter isoform X2 n=1 Tax=Drosophila innubila TaxID=198719 RepID=UPI00148DC670|nr:serine protease easter isoform X2 [Drosophila innubila]
MGINLLRDMLATTLLLAVVVVCSLTLSANGQRQGDCTSITTDGRVLGQCTPVRQCEYFMRILTAKVVSQSDRNLLRDNRCHQQNDNDVQVCCPLEAGNNKWISGSVAQPGRDALGALRHPLLPLECGAVKWERSNDTDTKIKEYPWLALIEYLKPNQEKLHACGGVLISIRYVLTAAHCVSSRSIINSGWEIHAIRLGEWDTVTNPDCQVNGASGNVDCAPSYQDVLVEEVIVHPLYNKDAASQTNDIAMVRLRDPAQLSDYVQPICLPNKQLRADELEQLVTEVAGWQAKSTSRPRKSQVTVTSIEQCQTQYAAQNIRILASQLCGTANTNECHGNSGGPLMLFKNDAYILGGLLSFGPVTCATPGWPDIYTRVASYIDWIHENLKP